MYRRNDSENRLAVLTPYLIPDSLRGRKVVNLGDGFILRAIERLIGRFPPRRRFSPRVALPAQSEAILEDSPAVILAGANQLNDRYSIWPGLTAERIRASRMRLVPFGIGLHGEPGFTETLSDATKEVLIACHERIEYSSWRCPHTLDYLRRELPQLGHQFLMTGCPVTYDEPLLAGKSFVGATRRIAVTVTERRDFWSRETAIIDFVATHFPRAERYLVLHQNFSPPTQLELFRHRWWPQREERLNPYQRLRCYAVKKGFRVICPRDADACMAFYDDVDRHFGSRLHAHLLCLSRAKPSWLVAVDGRAAGIAKSLGFPQCSPTDLNAALDFDFEIVRERAQAGFQVMQKFVDSLPR